MKGRRWFGSVIWFKQGDVEDGVDFGRGWKEKFIGNFTDAASDGARTVEFPGKLVFTSFQKRRLTISLEMEENLIADVEGVMASTLICY